MIQHLRRMIRENPDDAALLEVALAADLRPVTAVLMDLATVRLHAIRPRYGDPAAEPRGQNRWPTPGAAWPTVKARNDEWIDIGTWRRLRDRDVHEYLPGRAPPGV